VRRLVLLAGALIVPLSPVLVVAPAHAADNVICVDDDEPECVDTVEQAVNLANADAGGNLIAIHAGIYKCGCVLAFGSADGPLTVQGAGQGATILTAPAAPASQSYVTVDEATVRDLTIQMDPAESNGDTGLTAAEGATIDHVTVIGTDTTGATGMQVVNSQVTSSSIQMAVTSDSNSVGFYGTGGSTVTDTTITGNQGVHHAGAGLPDTLSRVTIQAADFGVLNNSGTVDVRSADIVMEGGGPGMAGISFDDVGTTINADHVTIVGSGPSSAGVLASATQPGGTRTSTVNLSNSIIRGPATSLVAEAGNGEAQDGNDVATINVSYTDYETTSGPDLIGPEADGGVTVGTGNVVGVDPLFVDPAGNDHHLAPGSPVVDKGNPAPAGPDTDRDGLARVLDGDSVVGAVRDMGAYERPAVVRPVATAPDTTAPETTITTRPARRTTKKKLTLAFSSEAGATFQCRVDDKAWRTCTSPFRLKVKQGRHVVLVRAIDAAGNVDATPAKVRFKRVPTPR
jgi:hypothetical protein